jgi:P pilus assembly chaperone PapD
MYYFFTHQEARLKTLNVRSKYLVVLLVSCLSYVNNTNAQGNLLVTPKRVVFEGNRRSEELNLAKVGKDSATFVISFIQIKMNDYGTFEQIMQPDSNQRFADKNLRFFPRTVTLAPNEAQTVKVQLTKANLGR